MLGNPLVGRPIAAEHTSTLAITSRFGCGFCIFIPTFCTSGSTISAATVWLIKVATQRMSDANEIRTTYRPNPPMRAVMPSAIVCSKPELVTALPRARPPAARMMIVQRKLLKSSLVKMPVPKKRAMGMMAMTPMSPKTGSSRCETHQRAMVMMVTIMMNH